MTAISIRKTSIDTFKGDCLVVPMVQNSSTNNLHPEIKKLSKIAFDKEGFKAELKESILMMTSGLSFRWVMFVGVGDKKSLTSDRIRKSLGTASRTLLKRNFKSLALLHNLESTELSLAIAALEGLMLGNYDFVLYKTKQKKGKSFESIEYFSNHSLPGFEKALKGISVGIEACHRVRDLGSMPPCDLYPESYARLVKNEATKAGVKCEIWNPEYLKKHAFHSVLGVGQGSIKTPRVVKLEYKPKKWTKHVVLVGKGVCFDSGGLSLKDASSMETMKDDMIGSAIVFTTLVAASRLKSDVWITGLMGLVENMPDGNSYKPGDVLRSRSGKTIEVLNTDAEGRLVLADLLDYASDLKPDHIIDMATLTGAALVAVGDGVNAIMGNDQKLVNALIDSGSTCGEMIWQLPLVDDYRELIASPLADVKNITGTRWGGTITAGLFLQEFVRHSSWAHIDLAGCWSSRERDYRPYGPTGEGPRFLLDWLFNL
jgi:leucyl aminopeptidase